MKGLPDKPNETTKKNNPHLFGPQNCLQTAVAQLADISIKEASKLLRQSSKPKMNKLESGYLDHLKWSGCRNIMVQSIKFELGNGVWYCPDFTCHLEKGDVLHAFEVKGFMRDDAAVKIKVAARTYPFIVWTLVHQQHGVWRQQVILP